MSHLSNRTILEKADLALAELKAKMGLLGPASSEKKALPANSSGAEDKKKEE